MYRFAALVLLVPSLALAGGADVSEPDNLPPPKQPQASETEPGTPSTTVANPAASYRKSVTLEASIGAGYLVSTASGIDGGFGLSGINLGVGGFLNNKIAITGRLAGVLSRGDSPTSLVSFGGAVQYWLDDKLWVGGGVGLGYVYFDSNGTANGFTLDARGGYTFRQTREHAFHASLEIVPGFIDGGTLIGIAALVGYQYL